MKLPYGSQWQSAREPVGWNLRLISLPPARNKPPESEIISRALNNPVGAPHLRDFVSPGDRVVVLVPDKTRLCRAQVYLPPLLDELTQQGVPDEDITVFFANGTHPPQSEAEKRAILGDDIYRRFRVEENRSRDESAAVEVGITAAGTPVRLHRTVAEADKVIATGTVVHHYFAGYGGGPKLFVPGCSSYSTAVTNHRRTLTPDGHFHSRCRDGVLEGNPVAEDIIDAMKFCPPAWYFATILDAAGHIARAFCGNLLLAHRDGCGMIDEMYRVTVEGPSDMTIVSAGGYPKDINFIQAHKALHRASYVTRPGGSIVLLAECPDGIGNDSFLPWFAIQPEDRFRTELHENYSMNAHTALAVRNKASTFDISFVTSLDPGSVRTMGMTPFTALEEAIEYCAVRCGPHPVVSVIPNGSVLLPSLGRRS